MKGHNNSKAVTSFLKYSQMISHMGDAIRPQYSYIASIDEKFEFFMEHIYRAIGEIRSGEPSISEYGDFSFNASLKRSPVKEESFPEACQPFRGHTFEKSLHLPQTQLERGNRWLNGLLFYCKIPRYIQR